MKLEIGNRITWVSAAGRLVGEITNVVLDLNAAGDTVPWIDIRSQSGGRTRLCATNSNLRIMQVQHYHDDMVERVNFMTGKTFMEHRDRPYTSSPRSETYWSS